MAAAMAMEVVVQWIMENELPAIPQVDDKVLKYDHNLEATVVCGHFRSIYAFLVARRWPDLIQHRLKLNAVGRQFAAEGTKHVGWMLHTVNRVLEEERWEDSLILEQLAGMSEDARNNWFRQVGLRP